MKYAKLNGGALEYAPRAVTAGRTHYNPAPESWLAENGYLPVAETPYPDDGKYYAGSWQERDGQIARVWTETEPPEAPASDTQVLDALLGLGGAG